MINPGTETFELDLHKQKSMAIGGLNVDLNLGVANVIKVPEFTAKAGHNYQLRVRENGAPIITELGQSDTDDFSIHLLNER
jgi:hypothetical protein